MDSLGEIIAEGNFQSFMVMGLSLKWALRRSVDVAFSERRLHGKRLNTMLI